jgi:diguanylate cyclase
MASSAVINTDHVVEVPTLAAVVDEHLCWLFIWHRLAFIETAAAVRQATLPDRNFLPWYQKAVQDFPEEQPPLDRLAVLHDQTHTLAKLVLMRTPQGAAVNADDYQAVISKAEELLRQLRRFEKAFAIAASGLDQLTGLRSRVGLMEDLAREHQRLLRTGKPYCLVLADIDHFKKINDTHGHDIGDYVLAAVAGKISQGIRSFDDAYRLGGEEFLICLKESDQKNAVQVIERLRAGVLAEPLPLPEGGALQVTLSFGLVEAAANKDITDLIKAADNALYKAKQAGRDQVQIATLE